MRNKLILFLSMLVAGVFLVAAMPAVANACSLDDGSCAAPDDNDMCMVGAPMCYAEDEPADEEPTTTQPSDEEPIEESMDDMWERTDALDDEAWRIRMRRRM